MWKNSHPSAANEPKGRGPRRLLIAGLLLVLVLGGVVVDDPPRHAEVPARDQVAVMQRDGIDTAAGDRPDLFGDARTRQARSVTVWPGGIVRHRPMCQPSWRSGQRTSP